MYESITIKTRMRQQLTDVTNEVQSIIRKHGIVSGLCLIYTPHTTAGVTINESADPEVPGDLIRGLDHLALESVPFKHAEGNSPAHIKSSLVGCSEMVIIEEGRLRLGTWQGIFFCEFDGPRQRTIEVKIISD